MVTPSLADSGTTPRHANGAGTAAQFDNPNGVAVFGTGDNLLIYVADYGNNCIREITPGGVVTTFAGGAAQFDSPSDVAVDSSGNVYVADMGNHRIRKITPGGGVTTIAGSGEAGYNPKDATGEAAQFHNPYGVAVDSSGNLYVADLNNNRIQKIEYK